MTLIANWCWTVAAKIGANRLKSSWNAVCDAVCGIRTVAGSRHEIAYDLVGDNEGLGTIDYLNLFRLAALLKPTRDDVFVDIGCGRGRVVCFFARRELKKVIGIELVEPLAEQARHNAARLRRRRSPIEIVNCDALKADFSSGTIYCFFNPFGEETLSGVLQSIHQTLLAVPRVVTVAYYHPKYLRPLREARWLYELTSRRMFGDYSVSVWRSRSESAVSGHADGAASK
jgi:SAM-dependent methyltransferase